MFCYVYVNVALNRVTKPKTPLNQCRVQCLLFRKENLSHFNWAYIVSSKYFVTVNNSSRASFFLHWEILIRQCSNNACGNQCN